ncbi:MAG: hypothetical protein K6E90_04520, partial [Lachnospiraceae bacterium]|nr:hypothetical protein [Lachnospiraceae bacterium]
MKIRLSDTRKIFNIHTDGIPYLSVSMLDELGVPNLYSTRFDSSGATGMGKHDAEDVGRGLRVVIMKDEDPEEAA